MAWQPRSLAVPSELLVFRCVHGCTNPSFEVALTINACNEQVRLAALHGTRRQHAIAGLRAAGGAATAVRA
jgi:hypothetical protein